MRSGPDFTVLHGVFRSFGIQSDANTDLPQSIAHSLPEIKPPFTHRAGIARFSRRPVDGKALVLKDTFYTEDMIAVAHNNAGSKSHAAENLRRRAQRISGRVAFGFDHYRLGRHSAADEIRSSYAALGKRRIAAGTARGHNIRGEVLFIEFGRMLKTKLEHR